MEDRDPNIVTPGLSRTVTQDGVSVELGIYRLEHDPKWTMEVVNQAGTSTVWDEQFNIDEDAHREFLRTIEELGLVAFLGFDNVVPFRR